MATADGFMSVWRDARTFETTHIDIYASRLTADGTLLDPAGIRVTSAPGQQYEPRIAWNGSQALVVWPDYRNQADGDAEMDVYGARIAADGTVLDPGGVPIATGPASQWQPDVAWNGSAWVVAWTHAMGNAADLRVRRLTTDLQPIGPAAVTLSDGPYAQQDVRLAVEGTTTVAIFTDGRDADAGEGTNIYTTRVAADGEVLAAAYPVRKAPESQWAADAAATAHGIFATWVDYLGPGQSNPIVRGQRIGLGGALQGGPIDLAVTGLKPRVTGLGTSWVVAWDDVDANIDADIMARTVNPNGVAGTPFELTDDPDSENITALTARGDMLFALAAKRPYSGGPGPEILGIRAQAGVRLDDPPISIATAARPQTAPAIFRDGTGWGAVWSEYDHETGWDVLHQSYGPDGAPRTAPPDVVAGGPGDQRHAAAASNGTYVLVAWVEPTDAHTGRLVARRLATPNDAAGPEVVVGLDVSQATPSVATNGGEFALGWGRYVHSTTSEARVQRFDSGGNVFGGPQIIATSHGHRVNLAPLGAGYLATWWIGRSETSSTRIEGKRLGLNTLPIDMQPLVISSSTWPSLDEAPAAAGSGTQALVTWIQRHSGVVQAARVTADGQVLDVTPITVSDASMPAFQPAVAWNGATYQVAWWNAWQPGLVGAEVTLGGSVLNRAALGSEQPFPGSGGPSLAGGSGGRSVVAYSRVQVPPPGGAAERGFFRFIDAVVDTAAPTLTSPVQVFSPGTAITAGKVPTRLVWSGSDTGSGVARYELRQRVDGGTWTTANANLTRASATLNLAPGHTYRYAVRAWDGAGNVSEYAYGTTFALTGVSEASSAIAYRGTWGTASATGFWGGRLRYATSPTARTTFTFTGRSVGLVTTMSPSRGRAAIYVDGAFAATVDLHSATWRNGVIAWSRTFATATPRTVELRVLGTAGRPRVDLDGWVVGS